MLLAIKDLTVRYPLPEGEILALRGVDLSLDEGQIHGLVGESGAGKSVTALAILGLANGLQDGEVRFKGADIAKLPESRLRELRGREIGVIFQEPVKHLNPSMKIGGQIVEMLKLHRGWDGDRAYEHALSLLELVGLPGGREALGSYPHEFSGGMCQRVMIAIAVSCHPSLLVADEPTTALDVTLQVQILQLLNSLRDKLGMGILLISHDLGVVKEISERISVMYAGLIIESGSTEELFACSLHPYTKLLLLSMPDAAKRGSRLRSIPGRIPDAAAPPAGCAFHPRCPLAEEICESRIPPLVEYDPGHTAACHMIGKKWIP